MTSCSTAYQPERAPHVSDIISISIFLGQIICIPDIEESQKRDAMFLSGKAPPMAPFPILTDGLLERDASGAPKGIAGQLAPHAIVAGPKGEGRLDDVEGTGFNLILAPGARVSPKSTAFIEGLGGKVLTITDKAGAPGGVVDTHGKLTGFLKGAGVDAILVRPDFYVYGSASGPGDADRLVQSLRADLAALGLKEKAPEPILTKG